MLVGIENPLLDISVSVDLEFLEKHNMLPNSAILATSPDHLALLEEIKNFPEPFYSAGGATQNAMRIAKWVLGDNNIAGTCSVVYIGCVGDDENMRIMKDIVENQAKVQALYQVCLTAPTGTCGVLLSENGKNRSLVANLGAANHFDVNFLKDQTNILRQASVIYSSGFLITSSRDSVKFLVDFVKETRRLGSDSGGAPEDTISNTKRISLDKPTRLVFNLAAPFICEVPFFRDFLVNEVIPHVDYLIGSDNEAVALSKSLGWAEGEDLHRIAQKILTLGDNCNKTVIITCGSQDTLVATKSGGVVTYPIVPIAESEIVDCNGCGDAYAGGFVAGLVKGADLRECCNAGAYAASEVIKRRGCTVPRESKFCWNSSR